VNSGGLRGGKLKVEQKLLHARFERVEEELPVCFPKIYRDNRFKNDSVS
jgi:hypothetical protein